MTAVGDGVLFASTTAATRGAYYRTVTIAFRKEEIQDPKTVWFFANRVSSATIRLHFTGDGEPSIRVMPSIAGKWAEDQATVLLLDPTQACQSFNLTSENN